ncbi:MAG TPA: type II toxin-antitoxin system RelE/ParE family toxin [Acetobacteraceae bacterium]|jgi:toxin ParE1/3/4
MAETTFTFRFAVKQGLRELGDPDVELIPHEQVEAEKPTICEEYRRPGASDVKCLAAGSQMQPALPNRLHRRLGRTGRVPGTRELMVARTSFVVIYVVHADTVQIIRVLHAAQRWPAAH